MLITETQTHTFCCDLQVQFKYEIQEKLFWKLEKNLELKSYSEKHFKCLGYFSTDC